MRLFLIAGGIAAALAIAGIVGLTLLRRILVPSPLRKGKMAPSGARPWQRVRNMTSLHGFASWHGTQTFAQAQTQAQGQATMPAAPPAAPYAPEPWLNQEVPFSQAAAWSQAQAMPAPAQAYQSQWTPPQQNVAPQSPPALAPAPAWNATPFASYNQPTEGWGGSTFASWNPPPATDPGNGVSSGNTGKFRRNSLLPFADGAHWNPPPAADPGNVASSGNTGKFRRNSLLPFADGAQPDTNEV